MYLLLIGHGPTGASAGPGHATPHYATCMKGKWPGCAGTSRRGIPSDRGASPNDWLYPFWCDAEELRQQGLVALGVHVGAQRDVRFDFDHAPHGPGRVINDGPVVPVQTVVVAGVHGVLGVPVGTHDRPGLRANHGLGIPGERSPAGGVPGGARVVRPALPHVRRVHRTDQDSHLVADSHARWLGEIERTGARPALQA